EPPARLRERRQALRERRRLDEERLAAADVAPRGVGGHERPRLDASAERAGHPRGARGGARGRRRPAPWAPATRPGPGPPSLAAGGLAEAVLGERAQVDVDDRGGAGAREARRLGDQLATLRDEPVPVPGDVGRRLAEAGGAVHLDGDVLRSGPAHEVLAVLPL